jgi:hypothetical protein
VADTLVDPRRFKNLLRRLTALSFSPVWRDGLVVAITLLRGRERDEVLVGRDLQLLGGKPDEEVGDYVRLDWLNLALGGGHDRQTDQWWCRYHLVNPVVRRYKSTAGTQSMIWIAATVRTHVAALADRASVVEIARRWRTGWGELEPFRPLCVEAMQARHGSVEDYLIMAWNYGGLRPDQPWAQIGALLPDRTESSRAFFAASYRPGISGRRGRPPRASRTALTTSRRRSSNCGRCCAPGCGPIRRRWSRPGCVPIPRSNRSSRSGRRMRRGGRGGSSTSGPRSP